MLTEWRTPRWQLWMAQRDSAMDAAIERGDRETLLGIRGAWFVAVIATIICDDGSQKSNDAENELCFGCAKSFAEREPSIIIDDREFCIDCASEEAGSATVQAGKGSE